jgi:nicotinamide mononucleotide (NMN) deamidase PncC
VGITGIAGPGGGSEKKPVGTVFIAVTDEYNHKVEKFLFTGTRQQIREQATKKTLEVLYDFSLQQTSLRKE